MNKDQFVGMKERKPNNLKFISSICAIFLLFINAIVYASDLKIELSITFVAIIEITVILLLFWFLNTLNIIRKNNRYGTTIKGWKDKDRSERSLFYFEFAYRILSYITVIYIIIKFVEERYLLVTVALYTIIIMMSIIMRIGSGYNHVAQGFLSKLILLVSICGIFIMSVCVYKQAWKECSQEKTFYFKDSNEYMRCKELYDKRESSYVVIQSGNNTAELRELTNEITKLYFAESDSEFKKFIDNNTMGIGINVPVLSGNCKFEKGDLSVKYEPVFEDYNLRKQEREIFSEKIYAFLGFELIIMFGVTIVSKKKREQQ